MRPFISIMSMVFLVSGCASRPFENWSRQDTYRQAAYTALHVVDWAQTVTIQIKKNNDL
jgi:hypothetical protein